LILQLLYELECVTVKVRSVSVALDSGTVRLWCDIGYTVSGCGIVTIVGAH